MSGLYVWAFNGTFQHLITQTCTHYIQSAACFLATRLIERRHDAQNSSDPSVLDYSGRASIWHKVPSKGVIGLRCG